MVACLHAVARQAQHVADTHGGAAQDVALNGDAVLVAAGDLHHRRVTDTRQQGADRHARHVDVGTTAVGGVDGIDVAVEQPRAAINLFGIRTVGRCQFGSDSEATGAQYALQAARRTVAGKQRKRLASYGLVDEVHGVPSFFGAAAALTGTAAGFLAFGSGSPVFSRTTRNHEDEPSMRRSTGACTT